MGLLGESNKNVYVKLLEKAKVYFHRLLGQTDQYLLDYCLCHLLAIHLSQSVFPFIK